MANWYGEHRTRPHWAAHRDAGPLGKLGRVGAQKNKRARWRVIDPAHPWFTPALVWAVNRRLEQARRKLSRWYPRLRRRLCSGWAHEDARQEVLIGLLKTARRWDPTRGAFSTLTYKLLPKQARQRLYSASRRRLLSPRGFSRGDPFCDGHRALRRAAETIAAPTEQPPIFPIPAEGLPALLDCLDSRSRAVVILRYIEGMSLEEVGEQFDRTRERIRQIEAKALSTLRERAIESVHDGKVYA